jgi:hypothetical protein
MTVIRQMFAASVAAAALSLGIAGCASQRPDVVPASAQLQTSGNGPVSFTPPTDGTAYVYDQATNRLLWSGPVRSGQMVVVDPNRNQIALGSQIVATRTLQPGDRNDIYFEPAPGSAQPAGMPMERQQQPPQPPPTYREPMPTQGTTPQGTGANPSNPQNPNAGTTVQGQGVLVTPSVTVTPTNPGQQQQTGQQPTQQPTGQQPPAQQQPLPPAQQPADNAR